MYTEQESRCGISIVGKQGQIPELHDDVRVAAGKS